MRKILVIAAREYKAAVRTKAFIVTLVLMPLMMGGSGLIQVLVAKHMDKGEKKIAIVDRTPGEKMFTILKAAVDLRNQNVPKDPKTDQPTASIFRLEQVAPSADDPDAIGRQRFELSERVRMGEFLGFVEIGADVSSLKASPKATTAALLEGTKEDDVTVVEEPDRQALDRVSIRYQTNRPTDHKFPDWLRGAATVAASSARGVEAGLPPAKLQTLLLPVPFRTTGLSKYDPVTGAVVDPPMIQVVAQIMVPLALVVLMFVLIFVGATPAMQVVVEEKMQRIAEVLLGSAQPFQIMAGKLTGLLAVSLTVAAVYLTGAYWAAWKYGFTEFLPVSLLAWFLVYQALAVLMFGSLFLAIGATASDIKETQTLIMPVMLVACLPMFMLSVVLQDPNNPLVVALSFFPTSTPMLMLCRQATPPGVPVWQPIVGIALVFLATIACVYAAGRIFRVGILLQGKAPKFSQLVRWAIQG